MADTINPALLRQLLRYDPESGKLTWKPRPQHLFRNKQAFSAWNSKFANKPAFVSVTNKSYRHGKLFNKTYRTHRVIWALVYGEWPADQVDHINGDPTDNRLNNLRVVTNTENQRNAARRSDNSSGCTGVVWHKRDRKWEARIKIAGRYLNLGRFHDIEGAIGARKAAERQYGYHPNHGRAA